VTQDLLQSVLRLIMEMACRVKLAWSTRRRESKRPPDVVMLGDSLTAEGRWCFRAVSVINRGIGGNTTKDVLDRLETIFPLQPRRVLLLVGINDLNTGVPLHQAVANYETILVRLHEQLPATKVFVQSVLPVNGLWPLARNVDIAALNERIKALADRYQLTFIDLNPHFRDGRGELQADWSGDGIHLNRGGYRRWASVIEPFVRSQDQPGLRSGKGT
jgi:lysophospholipase L1-like esterase